MKNGINGILIILFAALLLTLAPYSYGAQFETEPNNTFGTANPFALNGVEIGGQLSSATDVDVFKIRMNTPGLITLNARFENTNYDGSTLYISIKDASANILAGRDMSSTSTGVILNANAPVAGDYYLVVEKYANYIVATKNYFIAGTVSTDLSDVNHWEKEPNNSNILSNYFALDGIEIGGQLSSATDVDVFKFKVNTPSLMTFAARFENTNYNGSTLYISIKDANANILAGRDMSSTSTGVILNANAYAAGDYYLVVEKHANYIVATKNYFIAGTVSADPVDVNHWEKEPNNSSAASSYFLLDGIEFGGQLSSATDVDVYKFRMNAPGLLTFAARFENTNYDGSTLYISVKDAAGNVLTGKDMGSTSTGITLDANTSIAGDYYLVVEKYANYIVATKNYLITATGGVFNQYKVTVNATGTGKGKVMSNPAGIYYSYNLKSSGYALFSTPVILTATANAGSTVSWTNCSGVKSGNGTEKATCTFSNLDSNKTATVKFNSKPIIVSLTPSSQTTLKGVAKPLTAVYRDMDGVTDLALQDILVSGTLTAPYAIRARYNKSTNKLILLNSAGTLVDGSCTPGTAVKIQNAFGIIDCATTTISSTATDLTVKWKITPKFTGIKGVFLKATDKSGATSDWKKKGTWTITTSTGAMSEEEDAL